MSIVMSTDSDNKSELKYKQICCGDAEIAMATHISDSPECSGKTQQTQQVAVRRINNYAQHDYLTSTRS